MRSPREPYKASTGAEVIARAVAAQLKACFDAHPEPPNDNIDILIQRLIALKVERESEPER